MRIIKTDGASAKEVSEAKELSLRPEYYRCDYCGVAMARDGHEKCAMQGCTNYKQPL